MDIKTASQAAVSNIAKFGDTDVFPIPFENHVFFDRPADVLQLLQDIHSNIDQSLAQYAPHNIDTLAPVGYTGFRWVTQIEPLWNAYYLALTLCIAEKAEQRRLPEADKSVLSYRFQFDPKNAKFFSDSTWIGYNGGR